VNVNACAYGLPLLGGKLHHSFVTAKNMTGIRSCTRTRGKRTVLSSKFFNTEPSTEEVLMKTGVREGTIEAVTDCTDALQMAETRSSQYKAPFLLFLGNTSNGYNNNNNNNNNVAFLWLRD
jgi:hypothetical protein